MWVPKHTWLLFFYISHSGKIEKVKRSNGRAVAGYATHQRCVVRPTVQLVGIVGSPPRLCGEGHRVETDPKDKKLRYAAGSG